MEFSMSDTRGSVEAPLEESSGRQPFKTLGSPNDIAAHLHLPSQPSETNGGSGGEEAAGSPQTRIDTIDLTDFLGPMATKWFEIALKLGCKDTALQLMSSNEPARRLCFVVIDEWVNKGGENACWEYLCGDVLRSEGVGLGQLADRIEQELNLKSSRQVSSHSDCSGDAKDCKIQQLQARVKELEREIEEMAAELEEHYSVMPELQWKTSCRQPKRHRTRFASSPSFISEEIEIDLETLNRLKEEFGIDLAELDLDAVQARPRLDTTVQKSRVIVIHQVSVQRRLPAKVAQQLGSVYPKQRKLLHLMSTPGGGDKDMEPNYRTQKSAPDVLDEKPRSEEEVWARLGIDRANPLGGLAMAMKTGLCKMSPHSSPGAERKSPSVAAKPAKPTKKPEVGTSTTNSPLVLTPTDVARATSTPKDAVPSPLSTPVRRTGGTPGRRVTTANDSTASHSTLDNMSELFPKGNSRLFGDDEIEKLFTPTMTEEPAEETQDARKNETLGVKAAEVKRTSPLGSRCAVSPGGRPSLSQSRGEAGVPEWKRQLQEQRAMKEKRKNDHMTDSKVVKGATIPNWKTELLRRKKATPEPSPVTKPQEPTKEASPEKLTKVKEPTKEVTPLKEVTLEDVSAKSITATSAVRKVVAKKQKSPTPEAEKEKEAQPKPVKDAAETGAEEVIQSGSTTAVKNAERKEKRDVKPNDSRPAQHSPITLRKTSFPCEQDTRNTQTSSGPSWVNQVKKKFEANQSKFQHTRSPASVLPKNKSENQKMPEWRKRLLEKHQQKATSSSSAFCPVDSKPSSPPMAKNKVVSPIRGQQEQSSRTDNLSKWSEVKVAPKIARSSVGSKPSTPPTGKNRMASSSRAQQEQSSQTDNLSKRPEVKVASKAAESSVGKIVAFFGAKASSKAHDKEMPSWQHRLHERKLARQALKEKNAVSGDKPVVKAVKEQVTVKTAEEAPPVLKETKEAGKSSLFDDDDELGVPVTSVTEVEQRSSSVPPVDKEPSLKPRLDDKPAFSSSEQIRGASEEFGSRESVSSEGEVFSPVRKTAPDSSDTSCKESTQASQASLISMSDTASSAPRSATTSGVDSEEKEDTPPPGYVRRTSLKFSPTHDFRQQASSGVPRWKKEFMTWWKNLDQDSGYMAGSTSSMDSKGAEDDNVPSFMKEFQRKRANSQSRPGHQK